MSPAPLSPGDGRLRRSQRSRTAMIEAALALIREGSLPSSSEIAERAGVTQRTLFNQFGGMDALVMEAARHHATRVVELAPDVDPTLPFDVRLEQYTTNLEALLEETMHIRWAILTTRDPSALMLEAVDAGRAFARHLLSTAFAAELDPLDAEEVGALLDELEMVVDPITWRNRRFVQGLDAAQTRRHVASTLRALLTSVRKP